MNISPQEKRPLLLYRVTPADFQPLFVAGIELVAAHFTGQEPRPGANQQNRAILTEAREKALSEGRERLAQVLACWLDPECPNTGAALGVHIVSTPYPPGQSAPREEDQAILIGPDNQIVAMVLSIPEGGNKLKTEDLSSTEQHLSRV